MTKSILYLLMGLIWITIGLKQIAQTDIFTVYFYIAVGIVFLVFGLINYRKAKLDSK